MARSEISKMSRLQQQQNSAPLIDNGHRDPYALPYSHYPETPHHIPGGGGARTRGFETYQQPEAAAYMNLQPSLPIPPSQGASSGGTGRGGSAMLSGGGMDPLLSGFRIKAEIPSPHYRISGRRAVPLLSVFKNKRIISKLKHIS